MASVGWTLRSRRPHACGEVLCAEPGRPHAARSRSERSRAGRGSSEERSPAGRHEESDDCIVPRKPRTKPSDIGGGDGGGKAVGRRKGTSLRMSRTQSRNWHVTEAARPRIGAAWAAQAPMADHVRPSTGARCVSSARRDLCGGERGNLPPYRDHSSRVIKIVNSVRKETEIPYAGLLIPVIHPKKLKEIMIKYLQETAEFTADDFLNEHLQYAIRESYKENG